MEQNQNPKSNETKIALLYGTEILHFGKWIVTTKGILFERWQSGEADYFLEENSCFNMSFIKETFSKLIEAAWMEEIDYQHFISAWFYKLSLLKLNNLAGGASLSDTLSDMQKALENKFSSHLIQ